MLVRKSWATPRYAADKGLLLRDTEREIAAVRRICLLLERAKDVVVLRTRARE